MRHQRRAIRQPRPDALGQPGGGLGQHLPLHRHIRRGAQPGEGRALGEGGQRLRAFPGQRAADLAFTRAQRHGQQRVRRLGHPRAGEAQQRAALRDEARQRLRLPRVGDGAVGQHQHRQAALQQLLHRPAAEFREGRQRAVQVEQLPDQRHIGGGVLAARDQPDRAAAEALIEQHGGVGAGDAVEVEPHDLVADLDRQRQRGLGAGGAGRHPHHRAVQRAAIAGAGQDRDLADDGQGGGVDRDDQPLGLRTGRGQQAGGAAFGAGEGQAPAGGERGAEGCGGVGRRVMLDPIGDPECGEGALMGLGPGLQGRQRSRAVRRPGLRAQRGDAAAQFLRRHQSGGAQRLGPGGGSGQQQGGAASIAAGGGQRGLGAGEAIGPIRAGGPAIIDHDQQRPLAPAGGGWAPDRAGEAQDDQRRRQQAQRQQPPGRAVRRFLRHRQVAEQGDGREILPPWRRRRDAQQPPQDRQGRQRHQQPGRGEGDGSQA